MDPHKQQIMELLQQELQNIFSMFHEQTKRFERIEEIWKKYDKEKEIINKKYAEKSQGHNLKPKEIQNPLQDDKSGKHMGISRNEVKSPVVEIKAKTMGFKRKNELEVRPKSEGNGQKLLMKEAVSVAVKERNDKWVCNHFQTRSVPAPELIVQFDPGPEFTVATIGKRLLEQRQNITASNHKVISEGKRRRWKYKRKPSRKAHIAGKYGRVEVEFVRRRTGLDLQNWKKKKKGKHRLSHDVNARVSNKPKPKPKPNNGLKETQIHYLFYSKEDNQFLLNGGDEFNLETVLW